jgi:long-chain fatty acid transport protein
MAVMQVCRFASAITLAVIASGTDTAHAAGFELLEQSAVAQGSAYAGAGARADDPSTMVFNPAGITKLPGIQISAGVAGIFPQGTLASGRATTGSYIGGIPYAGSIGTNPGASEALPNLSVTAQISGTLFLGLAVTSPFGLTTKYPADSMVRYYALTTQLRTINIGPVIAWQALPQLSLGGGLNIETADAHLSNAVDFGAVGALSGLGRLGLLPGRADGSATIKGSDTALGWNIGALLEPMPGTRIGLAYRSAVFHRLTGSVTYNNVPAPLAPAFQAGPANAKLPEPSTVSLSVARDIGDWTLLGSLTYTGWSIFHTLTAFSGASRISTTQENFRDTFAVSLGADYRVNERLTLRAGTMFDQTPTRDQYRTPRIADNNRYWLSLGATYKPAANLALSAAYSHIFTADSTVGLIDAGPGTPNFPRGNLNAVYRLSIDILSVQATCRF